MGQHHSRAPPFALSSDVAQPHPIKASSWSKATRHRKSNPFACHRSVSQEQLILSSETTSNGRPAPSHHLPKPPSLPLLNFATDLQYQAAFQVEKGTTGTKPAVNHLEPTTIRCIRRRSTASTRRAPLPEWSRSIQDRNNTGPFSCAASQDAQPLDPCAPLSHCKQRASQVGRPCAKSQVPTSSNQDRFEPQDVSPLESYGKQLSPSSSSSRRIDDSLLLAAGLSLDRNPECSRAHQIDVAVLADNADATDLTENASTPDLATSPLTSDGGDQGREESSRALWLSPNTVNSGHFDHRPSSRSSLGSVDRLRRGPSLKLHHDSIDAIFNAQPDGSPSRSRALIDKLLGVNPSIPEPPAVETRTKRVQAQTKPKRDSSSKPSVPVRLRPVSFAQPAGRPTSQADVPLSNRKRTMSQPSLRRRNEQMSLVEPRSPSSSPPTELPRRSVVRSSIGNSPIMINERRSSLFRQIRRAKTATVAVPQVDPRLSSVTTSSRERISAAVCSPSKAAVQHPHFHHSVDEGISVSVSANDKGAPQKSSQTDSPPAHPTIVPKDSSSSAERLWAVHVSTSRKPLYAGPSVIKNQQDVFQPAQGEPEIDVTRHQRTQRKINLGPGVGCHYQDIEPEQCQEPQTWVSMLPDLRSFDDTGLSASLEWTPYVDAGVQASLAALRARESPGDRLRTILARQRILGESKVVEPEIFQEARSLRSRSLFQDDVEVRVASKPAARIRASLYRQLSDSRYASDELSSSDISRSVPQLEAARKHRERFDTGMAEASVARDDYGKVRSTRAVWLATNQDSARRAHRSSTSSNRRAKPSKLGYSVPDIMAWQAGLGSSTGNDEFCIRRTKSTYV